MEAATNQKILHEMQKRLVLFRHEMHKRGMKLTELTETISAELGMKPSEVKTRARYIREGGYLQSGGRGTGAPHMNSQDLAAFALGMVSFVEPTAAPQGIREMKRIPFRGCEWYDLNAAGKSYVAENPQSQKCCWYVAPLSPLLKGSDDPDVLLFMSNLADALVHEPDKLKINFLRCETREDGMIIKIQYQELATYQAMSKAYVAETKDNSDGMYFSDDPEPVWWQITATYQLDETQRDRRTQTIEISGDILSRIIRNVHQEAK